jgi:regulator of cell morphogenesis and NO signaling
MIFEKNNLISNVVSENVKTAHVFKKYNIDFCCGGGVSIEKACDKKNIDINELINELNEVNLHKNLSHDFNKWKLDFLCDYIENTHHKYVKDSILLLNDYSSKVSKAHGSHYPEVIKVEALFKNVRDELTQHLAKEEKILFPFIKQLVKLSEEKKPLNKSHFETIENPIQMMEKEHELAGDIFKEIAALTKNYTTPDWACNTFKALYAKLEEFEQDLHIHIHLENNILFPKSIILEKSFASIK